MGSLLFKFVAWLNQSWFKVAIVIIAISAALFWAWIRWEEVEIQKFNARRAAFSWAAEKGYESFLGRREIRAFAEEFWEFFEE